MQGGIVAGIVDDCSCKAEEVSLENDDHMHSLLERLVVSVWGCCNL